MLADSWILPAQDPVKCSPSARRSGDIGVWGSEADPALPRGDPVHLPQELLGCREPCSQETRAGCGGQGSVAILTSPRQALLAACELHLGSSGKPTAKPGLNLRALDL